MKIRSLCQKVAKLYTFNFQYFMHINTMITKKDNNEQLIVAEQIQKLQNQALKRARNLKRRPVSSRRKDREINMKNKSHEKIMMITPQKRYSIEKAHEGNEIDFMSQFLQTKQLNRKVCVKLKLEKYSFQHIIGCGMFGKVWKAEDRNSHKLYAIKQISKSLVITKKGIATVMNERQIIHQINHHLIPSLISAFQTQLHLYLVLPLMEKGDLRYHITKFKQFEQKQVRFFVACIVSVLEYLRKIGIIHRDIKPENLLLDQTGYLHLTDFGIAQKYSQATPGNCCGTPAYMAPQVIFDKQYGFPVDYYALGVLLYEMIIGERPYPSSNKQQLKSLMSKHSANIKKDSIPEGWSIQAADFVNKLLHRNPNHRLGSNSILDIKNHPWLKDFPWDKLEKRQIVSPYCEPFNHWEVDYKEIFAFKNKEEINSAEKSLLKGDLQEIFNCFTYEGLQKSMQYTTKPSLQMRM